MKKTTAAQNSFLKGVLVFTLLISFTVLIAGGFWIFKSMAPTPLVITDEKGNVLSTQEQIKGGQAVFQKYALMDYGTVLGHGSYLGPDYTAEALKIYVEGMQQFYSEKQFHKPFAQLAAADKLLIEDKVKKEVKQNRYDKATGTLPLSDAQASGMRQVRAHYAQILTEGDGHGIGPGLIQESDMPKENRAWVGAGDMKQQLADFFFWTAWLSSTLREGDTITYTNNWPYYEAAGNTMSYSTVLWSGVSMTLLILFIGLILYFYHRYKLQMEEAYEPGRFPALDLHTRCPSRQARSKRASTSWWSRCCSWCSPASAACSRTITSNRTRSTAWIGSPSCSRSRSPSRITCS